ncbi:type II toxin-antitoxin system VapC family toxin [Desulfurivibrio dismutans]|uniref:type II toxin-antitoxin system VapC family toxin n=1 Tax=Desulfurivibrio dismutans TaxID=1398908 RepID=UPI0023DB54EE|nr:PIN domain-containing protein [Desulfurivibrio alkaliphilus]MDF1615093.1 PIN domain-containing protein [Desulfurivibrio alkaliphilus]
MKKILIDSGPLIALFDSSDKYHQDAVDFLKNNKLPLITTLASITETLHLLDFNRDAQIDFIEWVNRGAVEVHNIENEDFKRLKELTAKYRDLPMDFADSCLVFLAEKLSINTIATIDRDFTIYRIKGRRKFKTILS